MRFVWFQPPLGSVEQPLRLCLALISAPGGKSAYSCLSSRGLGWAGERITAGLCSGEQATQRAGKFSFGQRPSNQMRLNRLSIREKICLPGRPCWGGAGWEWVVVTAFQTGYCPSSLGLMGGALPEWEPISNSCPIRQLAVSQYLKALENSSAVSQRPP